MTTQFRFMYTSVTETEMMHGHIPVVENTLERDSRTQSPVTRVDLPTDEHENSGVTPSSQKLTKGWLLHTEVK